MILSSQLIQIYIKTLFPTHRTDNQFCIVWAVLLKKHDVFNLNHYNAKQFTQSDQTWLFWSDIASQTSRNISLGIMPEQFLSANEYDCHFWWGDVLVSLFTAMQRAYIKWITIDWSFCFERTVRHVIELGIWVKMGNFDWMEELPWLLLYIEIAEDLTSCLYCHVEYDRQNWRDAEETDQRRVLRQLVIGIGIANCK